MKTIQEGTTHRAKPGNVWVGKQFECLGCRGKFMIEESDAPKTTGTKEYFRCLTFGCVEIIYLQRSPAKVVDFRGRDLSPKEHASEPSEGGKS